MKALAHMDDETTAVVIGRGVCSGLCGSSTRSRGRSLLIRGERRGLATKRLAVLKGDLVGVVESLMMGLQIIGVGIDFRPVLGGELTVNGPVEEQIMLCVDWAVVTSDGLLNGWFSELLNRFLQKEKKPLSVSQSSYEIQLN